ncbi:Undecaprenyl-diphosphatase [Streptomyces alboniger]
MSAISVGQAVVLGIVEGVTEFLPVSSTGHLKITEGLMNIPVDDTSVVGFTAVIQVGAIAAVLVYFFKDIVRIVSAWGRGHPEQRGAIPPRLQIRLVGDLRHHPDRHRRPGGQAAHRRAARILVGGGRLTDRRLRS